MSDLDHAAALRRMLAEAQVDDNERRVKITRYSALDGGSVETIIVSIDMEDVRIRDGGDIQRYIVESSHGTDRFVEFVAE